ncbi:MAG: MFS transporter [Chloroflexota bacterium]
MDTITDARARFGPLLNRNFALLWTGGTISTVGDFTFDTMLLLWIATTIARGQTWAPLAVSGLLVVVAIPTILVGPLAGVFADRWDGRRTMLAMDAIRTLLIPLLVPLTGAIHLSFISAALPARTQIALIYAIVFLSTCCSQFCNPCRIGVLRDVVKEHDQPHASSMTQITMAISMLVGPPIAAPLYFRLGPQAALVADAASFAVSFTALLLMRVPRFVEDQSARNEADFFAELRAGARLYRDSRTLKAVLITGIVIMLGAGALNALDVFFVRWNLHTSPTLYGWLAGIQGAGILAGAILASAFVERLGVARLLWGSTILAGFLTIVFARLTSFVPALAVTFVIGVAVAGLNVAAQPLLLRATPRHLLGRATALLNPAITLASVISIALAGWLVSTVLHGFRASAGGVFFGPIDTVYTVAGLVIIAAGIYAMVALRESRPHEQEVPSAGVLEAATIAAQAEAVGSSTQAL